MKRPGRLTFVGVGTIGGVGGLIAVCAVLAVVVALFGVESDVQSFGAACQGYANSIDTIDGRGPGQGVYNPVMPAGGMYLPSAAALHEIPPALMLDTWRATARFPGYDWTLLAGQMYQETRYGQDPSAAPGGANFLGYKGILQFGIPAWTKYGADGDHDGKKDLYDPADAAFGAANYMDALGVEQNAVQALLGYSGFSPTNMTYPDIVLTQAARYRGTFTTDRALIRKWYRHVVATVRRNPNFPVLGEPNDIPSPVDASNADPMQASHIPAEPASPWSTPPLGRQPTGPVSGPPNLGQQVDWSRCATNVGGPFSYPGGPGGPLPPTRNPVQAAVISWARYALGTPYVWGAPRLQGEHPTSFDCSSLVQWAWYQATRGRVLLGASTHAQYPQLAADRVRPGHEQPGDLVFFGFGAALHHVMMVYDPRSGTGIHAPEPGETVAYTKYDNAQHPRVWSDQVGIFRPQIPGGVRPAFPPSVGAHPAGQRPVAYILPMLTPVTRRQA